MIEAAELAFDREGEQETNLNQSIFYDRYEGRFIRWLGAQGLALNASDEEIIQAMEVHLHKNNTASIS